MGAMDGSTVVAALGISLVASYLYYSSGSPFYLFMAGAMAGSAVTGATVGANQPRGEEQ